MKPIGSQQIISDFFKRPDIRRYVCMYVYMYVCMYCRPMYVCMYVNTSMPVCIYVRMHACVYVFMYALCGVNVFYVYVGLLNEIQLNLRAFWLHEVSATVYRRVVG